MGGRVAGAGNTTDKEGLLPATEKYRAEGGRAQGTNSTELPTDSEPGVLGRGEPSLPGGGTGSGAKGAQTFLS